MAAANDPPETRAWRASLHQHTDFRDVIFVCNDGKEIPVHKIIVASQSSVLKAMFLSGFLEANSRRVPVNFPSPLVQRCVDFLYLGAAATPPEDTADFARMLEFADYYDIPSLRHHADGLWRDATKAVRDALESLQSALALFDRGMLQRTQEKTYALLADRFSYIYQIPHLRELFLSLPLPAISPLLSHPQLCVEELPLLLLLNEWAQRHGHSVSKHTLETEIFAHVRLGLMTEEELQTHVYKHTHIPPNMFFRARRHARAQGLITHAADMLPAIHTTPRPHKPAVRVSNSETGLMNRIEFNIRRPVGHWNNVGVEVCDVEDIRFAVTDKMSLKFKVLPRGSDEDDAGIVCIEAFVFPTQGDENDPWPAGVDSVKLHVHGCAPNENGLVWQGDVTQGIHFIYQSAVSTEDASSAEGEIVVVVLWRVLEVNGIAI